MQIHKIHFLFYDTLLFTKLHNEELNDLYSSPKIMRVKKSEKNEMGGEGGGYGGGVRRVQGFGGET